MYPRYNAKCSYSYKAVSAAIDATALCGHSKAEIGLSYNHSNINTTYLDKFLFVEDAVWFCSNMLDKLSGNRKGKKKHKLLTSAPIILSEKESEGICLT